MSELPPTDVPEDEGVPPPDEGVKPPLALVELGAREFVPRLARDDELPED